MIPTSTPIRSWLAVGAVALGVFLVVSAEQLPIGLLVPVGADLRVSEGMSGLMVTVPGIVAALAAPIVPVLAGRLDRRVLLMILMGMQAAASTVSALAQDFGVMLGSRVVVGIAIGGFWAIAGSLAARLVTADAVPRATAIIFGGVAAANVFGIPLGTLLGGATSWRVAFGVLATVAVLLVLALLSFLPPLAPERAVRPAELVAQLRHRGVLFGIVVTFFLVTGHLAAYTFVAPALRDVSGIDQGLVGVLLFAYGTAGLVGNFVAAAALTHHLRRTVLLIVIALAASILLFPVLGTNPAGGIALLVLWGLSFGGVSVSLQMWMLQAAPQAREAASALWVSVFNLSIGLGALVGGGIVDGAGVPGALLFGGALVVLAGVVVTLAGAGAARRDPRHG